MRHWAHSVLITWFFLVQKGVPLKLSGLLAVSPSATNGTDDPDWVEKVLQNKKWGQTVKLCQAGKAMVAFEPKKEKEEAKINITDLGPQDEFSDISPAEMEWIQAEYDSWCGSRCELTLPNRTDFRVYAVPSATQFGRTFNVTTGECKEAYGGGYYTNTTWTCQFKNLYTMGGALYAHILDGDDFPSKDLLLVTRSGKPPVLLKTILRVEKHNNSNQFQNYMNSLEYGSGNYTMFDGTTVAFLPVWHFNIGHALYDGVYPNFVALMQWKLHKDPFRVFLFGPHNPTNVEKLLPGAFDRNDEVMGEIGGRGIIRQFVLEEDPRKVHSIWANFVIGMGNNGQKLDMNGNFSIGAGRDLGATRLFRTHVYDALKIKTSSYRNKDAKLQGIIINNKRWGKKLGWIDELISKVAPHDINLKYIVWGKLQENGKINPSPSGGKFRDQILMISKTDIHVSSPGTAMMYQHFLADGAVHINLGENPNIPRYFMEEYMAEGAPYIRALYYWPLVPHAPYDVERIVDLMLEAKKLIRAGFTIPVPVNTNLSPLLKVVKAYTHLTSDPKQLKILTPLRLLNASAPTFRIDFIGNHFPHEFVYKYNRQHLNACLLEALTRDYGDPCHNCTPWGFPDDHPS